MAGSLLFVAVFTIEGFVRPGYDPLSMYVSELSLGPRGWIQISNFVASGVLLLAFAWGVAAEFRVGRASRAGPILFAIIAFSLLVSGPFVMDSASTPRDLMTLPSRLHWGFGALVFSLSPISCWVFWLRFRKDDRWRSFAGWTLSIAVITTLAVIFMSVGPTRPPAPPNALNQWVGFIQRTILVPFFIWMFTFAAVLYAHSRDQRTEVRGAADV